MYTVTLPVRSGDWNRLVLPVTRDAVKGFPWLRGDDDSLVSILVGVESRKGAPASALFDRLVNEVPPGSMGLMLQPYWSPGIRVPGPEAKGAMIGFGDVHTRAHMYRAILEGLAYALREGRERIEQRSGVKITELRIAGGGSQSDAAMQLTADIFGLPAARAHIYETSGLGAAIAIAAGMGLHKNFDAATRAMTRPGRVFPASHRRY